MTVAAHVDVTVGDFPALPYGGRDVIAAAIRHLGTHETGRNVQPFGAWYGLPGEAWCAMFESYVLAVDCGAPLPIATAKGYAWCPDGVAFFKRHNAFLPAAAVPLPGDIAFFDWSPHDGVDVAEHTAFVEYASPDGLVHVVGGNQRNPVAGQPDAVTRAVVSREYVLGFGRPRYAGHPAPPAWQLDGFRHPTLVLAPGWRTQTSANEAVRHAQRLLIAAGRNLVADGVFGPVTDRALRYFQHTHKDEHGVPLQVDGELGPLTWGALHVAAWHRA